jgi:DNA-binding beta-propeller fold protein YncE
MTIVGSYGGTSVLTGTYDTNQTGTDTGDVGQSIPPTDTAYLDTVVATISLGDESDSIAVSHDWSYVYVENYFDNAVSVIGFLRRPYVVSKKFLSVLVSLCQTPDRH